MVNDKGQGIKSIDETVNCPLVYLLLPGTGNGNKKPQCCHVISCYITKPIVTTAEAVGTESYDTSVTFQNLFFRKVDMGHGLQIWRAAVADS